MMSYLFGLILMFMVLGVVVLGTTQVPYRGVIALMGVSFCCCMLMVVLGRMFAALVMYIVYLGGLIVVFGYCVSVEKSEEDVVVGGLKYFIMFLLVGAVGLCLMFGGGFSGLLVYMNWEDVISLEVNGGAVFYYGGGAGLLICSWGLVLVLFSVLVILSWSRLGSLRPF